jgi:hypothetical protein
VGGPIRKDKLWYFAAWRLNTIDYEFTIEDQTTFTRPWTASVPMTRTDDLIYEYACHEGNIAMGNILRGARAQEAEEAARKGSK